MAARLAFAMLAALTVLAVAAPQGLLCLITATPQRGRLRAMVKALSKSSRLL